VASTLPRIEVYGTEGSVAVPDPNRFDGDVQLGRDRTFTGVEPLAGYRDAGRGYGLSDLARAVGAGGPHRQSAELGYHANEVLARVLEWPASGGVVPARRTRQRSALVLLDAEPNTARHGTQLQTVDEVYDGQHGSGRDNRVRLHRGGPLGGKAQRAEVHRQRR